MITMRLGEKNAEHRTKTGIWWFFLHHDVVRHRASGRELPCLTVCHCQ
jgi:hypothetical protein